jgi:hypothetical protein
MLEQSRNCKSYSINGPSLSGDRIKAAIVGERGGRRGGDQWLYRDDYERVDNIIKTNDNYIVPRLEVIIKTNSNKYAA